MKEEEIKEAVIWPVDRSEGEVERCRRSQMQLA